jgi:membrane protein DedA with SNARE-associated domain
MGIFPLYAFTGSLLWPALLISLFYAGRAAKLMRKKYELVASIPEAIRLFPLVGAIVIEIDAAMYAGLLWWLIDRLRGHRVSLK